MAQAADVLVTHDLEAAVRMEQDDDRINELHRRIFQHLMDDRWHRGVETAVDVTRLGRYYERFADHAESVASRVIFLVTGKDADELVEAEIDQDTALPEQTPEALRDTRPPW